MTVTYSKQLVLMRAGKMNAGLSVTPEPTSERGENTRKLPSDLHSALWHTHTPWLTHKLQDQLFQSFPTVAWFCDGTVSKFRTH